MPSRKCGRFHTARLTPPQLTPRRAGDAGPPLHPPHGNAGKRSRYQDGARVEVHGTQITLRLSLRPSRRQHRRFPACRAHRPYLAHLPYLAHRPPPRFRSRRKCHGRRELGQHQTADARTEQDHGSFGQQMCHCKNTVAGAPPPTAFQVPPNYKQVGLPSTPAPPGAPAPPAIPWAPAMPAAPKIPGAPAIPPRRSYPQPCNSRSTAMPAAPAAPAAPAMPAPPKPRPSSSNLTVSP